MGGGVESRHACDATALGNEPYRDRSTMLDQLDCAQGQTTTAWGNLGRGAIGRQTCQATE